MGALPFSWRALQVLSFRIPWADCFLNAATLTGLDPLNQNLRARARDLYF